MIKAHKIKLNPTKEQANYFMRASGVAHFAWNWALDEYKRRKAAGQEIDWNEIKKGFCCKNFPTIQDVEEKTQCLLLQIVAEKLFATQPGCRSEMQHFRASLLGLIARSLPLGLIGRRLRGELGLSGNCRRTMTTPPFSQSAFCKDSGSF